MYLGPLIQAESLMRRLVLLVLVLVVGAILFALTSPETVRQWTGVDFNRFLRGESTGSTEVGTAPAASTQAASNCPTTAKRDIQGICLGLSIADLRALCNLSQDIDNPFTRPAQPSEMEQYQQTFWKCQRTGSGKVVDITLSSQVTGQKVVWVGQTVEPSLYEGRCENLAKAVQSEFGLGPPSRSYQERSGGFANDVAEIHEWDLEGTLKLRAECAVLRLQMRERYSVQLIDETVAQEYQRQSETAAKSRPQF